MGTLYETLSTLCKERGIKGGRMCVDLGISKSLMTDLKSGRKKGVNAETAQKLASYFNVSVAYLLGEESEKSPLAESERTLDAATKELYDIWETSDPDERRALIEMARLIKSRRA